MRPKKILFLSRLYYPHTGGVEKHVYWISKNVRRRGCRIVILTEKFRTGLRSLEYIDNVKVVRFSYPHVKVFGLLKIWYILFRHRSLIRESDIVHCHDVFIWYLPFRFLFFRKPVYVTFHGWEGIYPVPKRFILLNKIAAFLSSGNLAAGKFIEKYYGIKADKVYYTAINLPKRNFFKKDKKLIIYVGRLDKDTGLGIILSALSKLKGYKIEFCGDGPLRDECAKIGKVHGFVDPRQYYEKAYICVSAGLTSILESLVYKCLVITVYNNPLKRDYLLMTPFRNWVVVKKNPLGMVRAIKYFSSHSKEATNKINQGNLWARKQTWKWLSGLYFDLWMNKLKSLSV